MVDHHLPRARHEERAGDPLLLQQSQHRRRVEGAAGQDHHGAADQDQRSDRSDGADVEHRRGDEVDLVGLHELVGADQHHRLGEQVQCVSTAPLGRPVVPDVYMIRAGESSGTSTASGASCSSSSTAENARRAIGVVHADELDVVVDLVGRLRAGLGAELVDEEHRGPGVLEDVGDLAGREPEVHRHADGAEPVRREQRLHVLRPVAHEHRHAVAGRDAPGCERRREPLDAVMELAPGRRLAAEAERHALGTTVRVALQVVDPVRASARVRLA